ICTRNSSSIRSRRKRTDDSGRIAGRAGRAGVRSSIQPIPPIRPILPMYNRSRRSEPDDRSTFALFGRYGGQASGLVPPKPGGRRRRGKSELRRAVRRITPGQGNLKESGTENIPLSMATLKGSPYVRSAGLLGPRSKQG